VNGITKVKIDGLETELSVFGDHNLLNMHAAWKVCQLLGVDAVGFVTSISSFKGASKRLELLARNNNTTFYRDFAHAPSKVKATIDAVKNQFPNRKLVAVLELHTYSSLNEQFMKEYRGAMEKADDAAVFYSKHALELKRMPELPESAVKEGFDKKGLAVFNDRENLEKWLEDKDYKNSVVLFMSSGNYDGLDTEVFSKRIVQAKD
jgi:UDP-N-acetylmuramate: L-alanyl-gamma-D-glutamyl-meso-diaminopimelate ligase